MEIFDKEGYCKYFAYEQLDKIIEESAVKPEVIGTACLKGHLLIDNKIIISNYEEINGLIYKIKDSEIMSCLDNMAGYRRKEIRVELPDGKSEEVLTHVSSDSIIKDFNKFNVNFKGRVSAGFHNCHFKL